MDDQIGQLITRTVSKAGLIFAVTLSLLTGCVSTQSLSKSDRASVSAVYLSPDVPIPPVMYYLGPAGGAGLAFGLIGALATANTTKSDRENIQALAESSGVHIEQIMLEELASALKSSGKLPLTASPTRASAVVKMTIKQYGFSVPHGFSSSVVPILFVQGEMTDKTGRVIWKGGGHLLPLSNPVDSVPAKTLNDPKVIETTWRKASQSVAKSMVDEFP